MQPTILILGAGASVPHGFPSGSELLSIAKRSGFPHLQAEIPRELRAQAGALYEALGGTLDRSIDAMLESRNDLIDAGKTVMARWLLERERTDGENREDRHGGWYSDLWDACDRSSLESFSHTPITVVTYNYDRSLEYWLTRALQTRFPNTTVNACAAALAKNIGPIHLHGQLGFLPGWGAPSEETLGYGVDPGVDGNCLTAARHMKIVHEPHPTDDAFVRARAAIEKAHRVIFLGFGYASRNVERLQLSACMRPNTDLYLCARGFTPQQQAALIRPHFNAWASRIRMGEERDDIVAFFRRFPETLI